MVDIMLAASAPIRVQMVDQVVVDTVGILAPTIRAEVAHQDKEMRAAMAMMMVAHIVATPLILLALVAAVVAIPLRGLVHPSLLRVMVVRVSQAAFPAHRPRMAAVVVVVHTTPEARLVPDQVVVPTVV